jgi:methionyl-tRNA synthetase
LAVSPETWLLQTSRIEPKVLSAVAWPYANGPRHLGHVAGFGVPSDVFSRYMRMAGHDVLMVSGTDEHGTPILVQADKEGVTPRALADRFNRAIIAEDLVGLGLLLRPVHPHDDAQPLLREPGVVPGLARQRLHDRADPTRGDQPVDRADPARPLHRGHLPDLWLRRGPRRPVRQLRQPARPEDLIDPRSKINGETPRSRRPSTSSSTCRRSPSALAWLDGREATGLWRPNVIKFSLNILDDMQAARDDPRHRLGHPGAARRVARQPEQEALRLVRRGHRLPLGVDRVGPPHR